MTRFIELTQLSGETFHLDADRIICIYDWMNELKDDYKSYIHIAVGSKRESQWACETRAEVLAKIEALDVICVVDDDDNDEFLTVRIPAHGIATNIDKDRLLTQLQDDKEKTPPGST